MVKISSLATIGGVITGLEFFQRPILRLSLFDMSDSTLENSIWKAYL